MRRSRRSSGFVAAMSALMMVGSYSIAGAAPPDGGGGADTGDVFADLLVILRDEDGVPILKQYEVPSEVEGETVMEYCVQPISQDSVLDGLPGIVETVNPVDERPVYLIPLMGDPGAPPPAAGEEVEVCDPWPQYAPYVTEAELERLNMARAPDEFYEKRLAEVEAKLLGASEITLDGAGRLTLDGVAIDASPEMAAIFRSLMTTGTVPGLSDPAVVPPFDTWMLAAAALGTASGKETPITIDAVQYYNRIATDIPDEYTWSDVSFLGNPPEQDPEQFVDFGGFSYTRSDVFPGCVTWLDVPTLTWTVSPIQLLADFDPLAPIAAGGPTVDNIAGFAQMADDVRKVIVLLHENAVIPGFFIDPVGVNTCTDQENALNDPAVNWDMVPADVIQTETVQMTASVYMPWAGDPVANARVRVTVDAVDDFTAADQFTAIESGGSDEIAFAVDSGNLVGLWPTGVFGLDPGDVESWTFDVTIAEGAPLDDYTLTMELIDTDDADAVLAADTATTTVHEAALTVLWTDVFDYVAQGVTEPVTARVFNPDLGQATTPGATLRMTVDAPEDFLLASQVSAYSNATQMVFTLVNGDLVGTWALTDPLPVPYDESITWFMNIGEGAPTGVYQLRLELLDGSTTVLAGPATAEFIVGYESGVPVVTITEAPDAITDSTIATFAFESTIAGSRFECRLDAGSWESCTSPVTYTGLTDGTHLFAVASTVGGTAVWQWTVDTIAPTIDLLTMPPAATTDTDATFTFATTGASKVLCSLDGAAMTACTSPVEYTGLELGDHTFLATAVDRAGNLASVTYEWTISPFVSLVWPARLADTRVPWIAADGLFVAEGPVDAGEMIEIQVAGRAGIPNDAVAVVANLTIAGAQEPGHATAFACGTLPPTSSVNYQPGNNAANEVMVKLSPTGTLCVYVHGTANVILDAVGYVPPGSDYHVITPVRLEDTRPGPVPGGETIEIQVAGEQGIPNDAVAVVANLTIAGIREDGHATAFACGTLPPTSNINYQVGRTVANEVMVKLSPTGTICVYVHGTANVILDAVGYVPPGSDYHVITPVRLEDTRPGPVQGGETIEIQVAGEQGIPNDAVAVMANLTIAGIRDDGHATAYQCGVQPPTSNINYQVGHTVANEVMVKLSPTGTLCVYVHGTANVILDAVGYL